MDKTVAARLSKHDREIDAIRKLIRMGMRLLVSTDQKLNRFSSEMNRMAGEHDVLQRELRQQRAAGRETDRRLNALIRVLERGGNGRGPSAH